MQLTPFQKVVFEHAQTPLALSVWPPVQGLHIL
jgi:hypothetical protein